MHSLSKAHLSKRWRELQTGLRHAFTTQSDARPWTAEESALMDRLAAAVVKRGMAAPATIFLESMGPMSFLGSQALHMLTPIVDWALETREMEQVACLLERRDTIPRLIALIERKSSEEAPAP
ncbi:MAG TPA: hypothetical protein VFS39_02320 [Nitrospira sp.]|nr:hypothetical protein [Nitrospira sp.]